MNEKKYFRNEKGNAYFVKMAENDNHYRIVALTPEDRFVEILDPKQEQLENALLNLAVDAKMKNAFMEKAKYEFLADIVSDRTTGEIAKDNCYLRYDYENNTYSIIAENADGRARVIRDPMAKHLESALVTVAKEVAEDEKPAMKKAINYFLNDVISGRNLEKAEQETL